METILEEAQRLVYGDRNQDYGHPLDDFDRAGRIIGAILGIPDVPAEKVPLIMEAIKISRECNRPKRDNAVDGAGYWATLEMVHAERERRKYEACPAFTIVESPASAKGNGHANGEIHPSA